MHGIAYVVIGGALVGCSTDFTRFTDGISTGSTTPQYAADAMQPVQPMPAGAYGAGAVQSSELPPVAEKPVQVATVTPPPVAKIQGTKTETPKTATNTKAQGNAAATTAGKIYIVQSGDTLSGIASRHGVTQAAVKKTNNMQTDMVKTGQKLVIPGGGAQAQVAVKTPAVPSVKPAEKKETRVAVAPAKPAAPAVTAKADNLPVARNEAAGKIENAGLTPPAVTGIGMRWPVRGRILSNFGQHEGASTNDGMDIMVPEGTSVRAAESGEVIYSGSGLKEFGNTILIRHEDNVVTVYGHNGQLLVQRGQKVRRGDEIAKSGISGNAKTPRLHFEVRKNSTPVNPVKYLEN
ncbi:MAG: Peptidase M23 family protein [Candidatus Tokpelaia hoelldobleri]|uniref:Peptidase M23 family protein n=1 Tax=Candidatus Tokpelaia hoelldobleri TaxID=1902579 RepID=A0A1U9JU58_9HYPH|nr:MAG: Peptidase M23 family protein [Candidatus Tokpelaia hoelldoblerii]